MFLYFRMLLTMGVGLYTSRVVLKTLGIEDFGLYNIVGGVVAFFAVLNNAMSVATQRFLTFDIGKNDSEQLNKTFNASLMIHYFLAFLVLVIAESLGLWFINHKLNIPEERMSALNWVYQFSVFTFLFTIIQVPYNALIVAREKMNVYAYVSFLEVILKLLIVYLLVLFDYDKLKLYAVLIFCVSLITRLIYRIYCKRKFKEAKVKWFYDKKYYQQILSFSGWSLFTNIAYLLKTQGINLLLNMFFGVVYNAAYGITNQVYAMVDMFLSNIQVAVNPQIIKNYANGQLEKSMKLVEISSKLSFFVLLIIILPLLFNIDYILSVWLGDYPEMTSLFITLLLINLLIDSLSKPFITLVQASGKIKLYQMIISLLIFLNLPIAYLLIKYTGAVNQVFMAGIFISFFTLGFRIYYSHRISQFDYRNYLKNVLFRVVLVILTLTIPLYALREYTHQLNNMLLFMLSGVVLLFVSLNSIYWLGLKKEERIYVKSIFNKLKTKFI